MERQREEERLLRPAKQKKEEHRVRMVESDLVKKVLEKMEEKGVWGLRELAKEIEQPEVPRNG